MELFTNKFHVHKLQTFLTKNIQQQHATNLTPSKFIQTLKKNKHNIFHEDDMPGSNVGPIHGLALQLYARGIIGIEVADRTKIGTKHLHGKHLRITLPAKDFGEEVGFMPAYTILESYHGLNTVTVNN